MSARDQGPTWRADQLFARDDWELSLGEAETSEIVRAIEGTRALDPEELTPERIDLPTLAPRFTRLRDSLENGSGACLVRGLDLDALRGSGPADVLERAFFSLAQLVGTPVSQSAEGELLLPVRDAQHEEGDARVRGPNTRKRLSFHTDRCDVIAFLCVHTAASGGETHLVSSVVLHEELARRHPRELEILSEPFPYLRHTVDSGNDLPFVELPVFSEYEGHFAASFLRVLIDRAHHDPKAPTLTPEQVAALDTLEVVAEDPRLYARFSLQPGDILFLNNWVTFHRRTAFEDPDDAERRRLLLRLWLSVPGSRPLDPCFADHFGATAAGAIRGGMRPRA